MVHLRRFLFGLALACAVIPAPAMAAPALVSFAADAVDPIPGYFLGYQFTANANCTVDALGAYDHDGDGLVNGHRVGIWDSSCNLLAEVTVLSADPLTGQFRYRALGAPIALVAGSTYLIAAEVSTPDPYVFQASGIVFDARISYVDSYFNSSNVFGCPNVATGGGRQYMSCNFNLVDEPTPALRASWGTLKATYR